MRIRAIFLPDRPASDEKTWRHLAARFTEPRLFSKVDFLMPACRYFKKRKSVVLPVAEEGAFQASFPVSVVNLPAILSPPVITSWRPPPVISSWRHPYGFRRTPLVAPERGIEALESLLATP